MKTRASIIIATVWLMCLYSSCFLSRDPHGHRTDMGRHYPHDKPQQQQAQ